MAAKVDVPATSDAAIKDLTKAVNEIIKGNKGTYFEDAAGVRWRILAFKPNNSSKSFILIQFFGSNNKGALWKTAMAVSSLDETFIRGSVTTSYDFSGNGLEPQ